MSNGLFPDHVEMNDALIDHLKKKMVETCVHQKELEEQKRAMSKGFKDQIDEAEKRIYGFAEAISKKDLGVLFNLVDEYEFEELSKL